MKNVTSSIYSRLHSVGLMFFVCANLFTGNIVLAQEQGNALHFDGSNDFIRIPDYYGVNGTIDRTVEAWIQTNNSSDPIQIFEWGANLSGRKWGGRLDNGQLRAEVGDGYIVGTTNVADGSWHHVAVVFQNDGTPNVTDVKLYVDGGLETISSSASQAINTQTSSLVYIGSTMGADRCWDGHIDEFRIWSSAQSQAQIQEYKNKTNIPLTSSLKAYYRFDEGIAGGDNTGEDNLPDETGDHNGNLVNFALNGSTSNWVASGAGIETSLPVELFSFSARCEGRSIILEWTTESEIDNLGFILERSLDNQTWTTIASYQTDDELAGQGNTSSKTEYAFTDENVQGETTYCYRLSDVSTAGEIEVYNAISITLNTLPQETGMENAYPNPFNPDTYIAYHLAEDSEVQIFVYDMLGRKIQTLYSGQQLAGSYHVYWNGKSEKGNIVSTGTYLILMRSENTTQVQKVMLMK